MIPAKESKKKFKITTKRKQPKESKAPFIVTSDKKKKADSPSSKSQDLSEEVCYILIQQINSKLDSSEEAELSEEVKDDPEKALKLIKNRESASKSRKKKKAMFESLKEEIVRASIERGNIRYQMHQYIELLEKAYKENEELRKQSEEISDENSKLKDSIIQIQQMLNDANQSICNVMIHKNEVRANAFTPSSNITAFTNSKQ